MPESLKQKTFRGIGWSAVERFSVQGVSFLIQIVLARLLVPSDYGIIGMLVVFLQIAQVFIDSGFANALIQKQDCTEIDYSTVFYYNLVIAVGLYILLFFSAPLVAKFYDVPLLTIVMRVISITLILNALSIIQKTKLVKAVDFKSQTKVSLLSSILSGCIGIVLAFKGFGVWALCWQQILNSTFQILFFFIFVHWLPKLIFSKESFKSLFNFGSKLLTANLIGAIYKNLYTIVIGKKFSAQNLGYYSRAEQFAMFPSNNLGNIIARVAYPIFSKIQDDNEQLRNAYRKIIRYSSFIIFPLMIVLFTVSKPLIIVLLTDRWLGAVIILQILCLDWMFDHLSVINLNLLYVKGRSDLALKLEIIKKTIAISILFASIPFGLIGMCWGRVLYSLVVTIINTYYTNKLISLSFFRQMKDIIPYLLSSLVMGGTVILINSLINNFILQLLLGVLLGAIVYMIITLIFFRPIIADLIPLIKKR